MTKQELIFKKAELQRQMEALKQKAEAIDRVLELFQENAPTRASAGRYKKMSVAKAVVEFLSRTPGEFMHVAGIAAALKRGGIKSKSPNFMTIVSSTCNRLATGKKQKLVLKKKRKPDRKLSPYQAGEAEKMSRQLQPSVQMGAWCNDST